MRKIHEVLRLSAESHLSERTIAKGVALSRSTVSKIINRAKETGLSRPLPPGLDDSQLESMLFPVAQGRPTALLFLKHRITPFR